jgi:hypothetical protein
MKPRATQLLLVMALMGCAQQRPTLRENVTSARTETVTEFSGPFTLRTRVTSVLYFVRDGKVERICSHVMMRSPNAISRSHQPDEPWQMAVTLTLTNAPAEGGRTTYSLSSTGCSRTTTSHTGLAHAVIGRSHKTNLVGGSIFQSIAENDEALCFVEGNSPFVTRQGMTPAEFGRRNKGSFILVTLKWYTAL